MYLILSIQSLIKFLINGVFSKRVLALIPELISRVRPHIRHKTIKAKTMDRNKQVTLQQLLIKYF